MAKTVCACIGVTMAKSGTVTNGWLQEAALVAPVAISRRWIRDICLATASKVPRHTNELRENCARSSRYPPVASSRSCTTVRPQPAPPACCCGWIAPRLHQAPRAHHGVSEIDSDGYTPASTGRGGGGGLAEVTSAKRCLKAKAANFCDPVERLDLMGWWRAAF